MLSFEEFIDTYFINYRYYMPKHNMEFKDKNGMTIHIRAYAKDKSRTEYDRSEVTELYERFIKK